MLINRLRYYIKFLFSLAGMNARLLWGVWKLTELPQPSITIFGGARTALDSAQALQAQALAKKLASHGFSIITGGGPGIMEAANLGAVESLKECSITNLLECKPLISAGIGLTKLNKERANPFVQKNIIMGHFFERKWLLVRYATGFVVCPGGFGTMDEFFEIITLIQCDKMPRYPVILLGKEYWQPIVDWAYNNAVKGKLLEEDDCKIFTLTDDVDEAVTLIINYHIQNNIYTQAK